VEIPILANVDVLWDRSTGALAIRQHLSWRIGPVTEQPHLGPSKEEFMTVQLTDSQQVTLTITGGLDAKGAPVTITDVPTWVSNTPTVVAVAPSADGLSCNCVAGVAGTAQIVITDPTSGITDTVDIVVVAGALASFAVTAGVPVSQ
jgi:hypothetical protein